MNDQTLFHSLTEQGYVTPATEAILTAREEETPPEVGVLSTESLTILECLCDRLRPPYPEPPPSTIARWIDGRLAKKQGDGWRYDVLPEAVQAHEVGLAALDRQALLTFGRRICDLTSQEVDQLINLIAADKGDPEVWAEFPASRFFEMVLIEVVTFVYSRPSVQDRLGYVGYADAEGWREIGLNERERWEQPLP